MTSEKSLQKFENYIAELEGKNLALSTFVKELIQHSPDYALTLLEATKSGIETNTGWKEIPYQAVIDNASATQAAQHFIRACEEALDELLRFSKMISPLAVHPEDDDQPSLIFSHTEQ